MYDTYKYVHNKKLSVKFSIQKWCMVYAHESTFIWHIFVQTCLHISLENIE